MTKGELIVASIKLMFDNGDVDLDPSKISANYDYQDRTKNIIESINRALYRIQTANKLPKKFLTINNKTSVSLATRLFSRYNLSALTNNEYYRIVSVAVENENGYSNNVDYRLENDTIVLPKITDGNVNYIVCYMPKIVELTYQTSDTDALSYPNEVLNIIPYFVKGDLYEDDDISSARYSRNIFEQYLEALPTPPETSIKKDILSVYSW